LTAGKHVFVEKPLAAEVSQAEALVDQAQRGARVLMVGHTFSYSPPVALIRDLITDGDLGEVYFISSTRVNLGIHQPDVSVIWDLAPHDFSILFDWLGEAPLTVSATGAAFAREKVPEVAFVALRFPSGVIAHVEVSWLAPSKLRRTTVVGSRKMVVYDDTQATEKVKVFDRGVELPAPATFGEFQLSYRTGDIVSPRVDATEPLALATADFLRAMATGDAPRANGQRGLEVVRALAAAQASLEQGGVPVKVPS